MGGYKDSGHREAIAHSCRYRVDVGLYPGMVVCEKLPAPPITTLHAVGDEYSPVRIATRANLLEETITRHPDTAYALYALYDDRRDVATLLCKTILQRSHIIEGQKDDVVGLVDRR